MLQKELDRIAVPGRAVDDRLAVRRKARRADRAAAEGDLLVGGRHGLRETLLEEHPGGERREQRGGRQRRAQDRAAAPRGRDRPRAARHLPRDRHIGQMLAHAPDVPREVARGRVALLGILLQASLDDPPEGRRDRRVQALDRLGLLADDGGQGLGAGSPLEGALAGRHFVEDRPQRELVGAEVERPAARLLGRHVADGPHDRAGPRRRRDVGDLFILGLQELRQAEVEDLDDAVLRDHDVFGLQVAVDDPGGVRLGEPVGDLVRDVEQPLGRQRTALHHFPQGLPVHQLHRDVDRRVRGPDLVDRDDVVVVQGRGRARLLLEPVAPVGVGRKLGRKDLDRDLAAQA